MERLLQTTFLLASLFEIALSMPSNKININYRNATILIRTKTTRQERQRRFAEQAALRGSAGKLSLPTPPDFAPKQLEVRRVTVHSGELDVIGITLPLY